MMKKLILFFSIILSGVYAFSQGHLDGIIVEKVPVTAAANAADPSLPVNAFAYRVFVDMAAGWEVQNVNSVPAHAMIIGTTSSFYNNIDGTTLGRSMTNGTYNNAAGRFDSYVTIAALTSTRVGILAAEDITDGTVDGYTLGTSIAPITLGETFETQFGTAPFAGTFTTNSGIYGINGGAVGTTPNNRVLIGQFTTDGDFNFELNVQIRLVGTGTVENFVARNATGAEILFPGLIYSSVESNIAPVAAITSPVAGNVFSNRDITVTVSTSDANTVPALQAIQNVEFRVDGGAILTDVTAPYSFTWNTGAERTGVVLEARATNVADNLVGPWAPVTVNVVREQIAPVITSFTATPASVTAGQVITFTAAVTPGSSPLTSVAFQVNGTTVSPAGTALSYAWTSTGAGTLPVSVVATTIDGTDSESSTVEVLDASTNYIIVSSLVNCNVSDRFCVPVRKVGTPLLDVTGFDFTVIFDATKVKPTGQIDVNSNLGGANNNNTAYTTNIVGNKAGNDTMYVSVYLDGNSLATDGWDGIGDLFCIGFAKTTSFLSADVVTFNAVNIIASKVSGNLQAYDATAGSFATFVDHTYTGFVNFWFDNQPIFGQGAVATNIGIGSTWTTTDADGKFVIDFGAGTDLGMVITKEVANSANMLILPAMYGGYDAYLTAKVLVNNKTFIPSAQQMIAMDVNRDGKVSAGDISQINQRAVGRIAEFTTAAGTHFDWVFYNETAPLNEPSWANFSKESVPVVPGAFGLQNVIANPTTCPVIIDGNNTYYGIALGDVDGSWADVTTDGLRKSASKESVIFDFAHAYVLEDFVDVPLMITSESVVNSLDFAMEYNTDHAKFESISNRTDYINFLSNTQDQYFAVTSYSISDYEVGKPLMFVRFYAPQGFEAKDITTTAAYINGKKVYVALESAINVDAVTTVNIYPNPVSHLLNVEVPEESTIQLFDMAGKSMFAKAKVKGIEVINVKGMASGIYTLKVSNSSFSTVKQIVITK